MLYIDPKRRDGIEMFYTRLHKTLNVRELRHSDLRERVLRKFHTLSHPISVYKMVSLLNEGQGKTVNYSSVVRHVRFFNELGWLKVVNKRRKEYLLVGSPLDIKEDQHEIPVHNIG